MGFESYEINTIPLNKLFHTTTAENSSVNFDNFPLLYTKQSDIEKNDISGNYFDNNNDLLSGKCTYFEEYYSGSDIKVSNLSSYNKLSFIIVAGGGGAGSPNVATSGSSGAGGNMFKFNTVTGKSVSSFTYSVGAGGNGGIEGTNGSDGGNSTLTVNFTDLKTFSVTVYGGSGGSGGAGGLAKGNATININENGYSYVENLTNSLGLAGGNARGSGGSYQANEPVNIKSGFFTYTDITLSIIDSPSISLGGFLNYPTTNAYANDGIGIGGYGIRHGPSDIQGNNGGSGYIRCYFA